jgi:hypothetical protein
VKRWEFTHGVVRHLHFLPWPVATLLRFTPAPGLLLLLPYLMRLFPPFPASQPPPFTHPS